jgi:tRNA A37 threonylcarbamoyladenosine synthetase subunit TsaC/SUA5/YrdC
MKSNKLSFYRELLQEKKKNPSSAIIFSQDIKNCDDLAALIAAGGIVAIPWGGEDRRIYCLICDANNAQVVAKMNILKGRPANQAVALGVLPQHIKHLVDLDNSHHLFKSQDFLRLKSLEELLQQIYGRSIGLILPAHPNLPDHVTVKTDKGRTVMVVGEVLDDIFNETLRSVYDNYGKFIAGTSANPAHKEVFSVYTQDEAYEFLKDKVDAFVKYAPIPKRPKKKLFLTSSTIIDLTLEEPTVLRWGNLHPHRFKNIFPNLKVPKKVSKNSNHEGTLSYYWSAITKNLKN